MGGGWLAAVLRLLGMGGSGYAPPPPSRHYAVRGSYTAARTLAGSYAAARTVPGAYTAARTLPTADLTGGS